MSAEEQAFMAVAILMCLAFIGGVLGVKLDEIHKDVIDTYNLNVKIYKELTKKDK